MWISNGLYAFVVPEGWREHEYVHQAGCESLIIESLPLRTTLDAALEDKVTQISADIAAFGQPAIRRLERLQAPLPVLMAELSLPEPLPPSLVLVMARTALDQQTTLVFARDDGSTVDVGALLSTAVWGESIEPPRAGRVRGCRVELDGPAPLAPPTRFTFDRPGMDLLVTTHTGDVLGPYLDHAFPRGAYASVRRGVFVEQDDDRRSLVHAYELLEVDDGASAGGTTRHLVYRSTLTVKGVCRLSVIARAKEGAATLANEAVRTVASSFVLLASSA